MSDDPELRRVTEICLSMPEAESSDHHPPHRGFKVAQKNFAWYTVNEHGSDMVTLVVRTSLGEAGALVATARSDRAAQHAARSAGELSARSCRSVVRTGTRFESW